LQGYEGGIDGVRVYLIEHEDETEPDDRWRRERVARLARPAVRG
jgi:hypothetical protein